jgi:hypothetical protein
MWRKHLPAPSSDKTHDRRHEDDELASTKKNMCDVEHRYRTCHIRCNGRLESDLSSAQLSLKFSVSLGILKDPKPLPRTLGSLGRARERLEIPREELRIPRERHGILKDP